MRICLFSNARDTHTWQLVKYLNQKGYNILLMCHTSEYQEISGCTIKKISDIGILPVIVHLYRLRQMGKILRDFKPDLLYCDTVWPRGVYGAALNFHPLVLSVWGSDIAITPEKSLLRKILVKWALKKTDVLRVHDKAARKRAIELGCSPEKIIIHILGTDTKVFSPEAKSEDLRHQLGLEDYTTIISVRKLIDYYDVKNLIMAIPHILKKETKVRFLFCGEGNQKSNLIEMVNNLGITNYVQFLGMISHDQLAGYIAGADIFVDTYYTSWAGGGIGVGLIEAMSCGLAPIVAKRPGINFAVKNGFHGLHFEGGNPSDLAEKILELVADKEKMKIFGERSRQYMLQIGDYSKNFTEFEKKLRIKLSDHL